MLSDLVPDVILLLCTTVDVLVVDPDVSYTMMVLLLMLLLVVIKQFHLLLMF